MLRRAAGFTAAIGLAALALMPGTAANAASTPQPVGGGTGWTLVENQGGDGIGSTWEIDPGIGGDCTNSSGTYTGSVSWGSGIVDLATDGTFGNCAEVASPYTIGPTSADPDVFIEYEATFPGDTWAALWATGNPGPWPNTGEIDTAEDLGTNKICSHYHYGTQSDQQELGGDPSTDCQTFSESEPATYGVEWQAGQLNFYYNGSLVWSFNNSVISTDPEQVVLDNTTGGWEEPCKTCTDWGPESSLIVQYVRVWVK
jgi:hypothetical protein